MPSSRKGGRCREPLRPALVSPEHQAELTELRRFRHFLRNAYAVDLDAARLDRLADIIARVHPGLDADLAAMIDFLEAIRTGCQE